MKNTNKLHLIAITLASVLLSACGGSAETVIIEREPIEEVSDEHDHDHGDEYLIESMGRLAVSDLSSNSVTLLDIDDGSVLDTFTLPNDATSITNSASYRYLVLTARSSDEVGFLDGGLWREDHVEHLHDYQQAPEMADMVLAGSRPTHVSAHDGILAIFYDGDSDAGVPAGIQIVTDTDITTNTGASASFTYTQNMHGVAKPWGDYVVATVRRDDAQSTSANTILPDQVGVFHIHDDELELEQTLDVACPDLHGAAQNHEFLSFGCSDGVLVVHQDGDTFESLKINNIAALDGVRVGTLYGHENSEAFVGIASSRATGEYTLVTVNPEENEMEELNWDAQTGATPVAYSFSFDGAHFLILDSLGNLSLLAVEEHNGHTHIEFEARIAISQLDLSLMPDGASFAMVASKNDNHVYVSDPIAEHVLQIDIETMSVESDMALDFVPDSLVWLGIAEESEGDHGHDHD